jgi:hypothetical protein
MDGKVKPAKTAAGNRAAVTRERLKTRVGMIIFPEIM